MIAGGLQPNGPDGETGRHKRLKISRRRLCRFEPGSGHQMNEYPRPWKSEEETDGRCVIDATGRWVFGIQYDEADRSEQEVDLLVEWIVDTINKASN